MATKAEYLSDLTAKCLWVGTPVENPNTATNTGNAWHEYSVLVFAEQDGKVVSAFQVFYVFDEGGAGEAAYTAGTARKSASAFQLQLRAFLDGFLNGTILRITVDRIDEANEFAICTAYKKAGTPATVTPTTYFVYKDAQGAGQFVEYVAA